MGTVRYDALKKITEGENFWLQRQDLPLEKKRIGMCLDINTSIRYSSIIYWNTVNRDNNYEVLSNVILVTRGQDMWPITQLFCAHFLKYVIFFKYTFEI